jgi:outer membrane receptor for ferrienterochelin and colicins
MAHPIRTRCLSTCSLVLLTLAALSGSAFGQSQAGPPDDTQPVADLDLEQLLNVEVQSVFGASKFLQKITEAPASVTVITAEEIRRFGYRNLADALRNVRGFFTTYDRIYAFAGVRGFQRPGD